ncbi:uridine diphosphate-N-acetylglucosamine-binding protein YvcK [Budvicia aquatica]|nr:uridine diphosphate-N-acetylglucosamine-binding protein YvcK [Budvicia aquatica]PHI30301.1 hypothetical protein CRN84_13640 [Budvicia aquatica]GKX50396.1 putative gluconeogenesis factor [Budvicia aquatica]
MRNRTLSDLEHVVALGGGHGLGRVMSALSPLGSRLTGIVTTTDNGGSTGRIRQSEGGIAWGDTRNCLNQLITEPSIASTMFEYRFSGNGELAGHNLGNLMLKALDNLSVRPLEAINLIRNLLKINAYLIPMSEHPVDLAAIDSDGHLVYGEVNVDSLKEMPKELMLEPVVSTTREAIEAVEEAELILIGPGSFMTSLMPPLLLGDLAQALGRSKARIIYIGNLAKELSPAAASLTLTQKMTIVEEAINGRKIDGVIVGPQTNIAGITNKVIVQQPLEADDVPYRHDRDLLRKALETALQKFGR